MSRDRPRHSGVLALWRTRLDGLRLLDHVRLRLDLCARGAVQWVRCDRGPDRGTHSEKAFARAAPKQTAQGTSPLTDVLIPSWLPRSSRTAYFAAALVADEKGEVQGGQATLQAILGYTNRGHVCRALDACEEAKLIKRVGTSRGQRLFVLVLMPFSSSEKLCETGCGDKVGTLRGSKRCPTCLQGQRREWKGQVLDIWREAMRQGLSDGAFLTRAHNKVRRVDAEGVSHAISLWGRAEDGVQGSGSGAGESLVSACVEMGILDDEWLTRARRARNGDETGEE